TGGGRGIGKQIALRLAEAGAVVAINYRSNSTAAEETVQQIRATGAQAIAIAADVTYGVDVNRMVATISSELGPIDLLVNNAGIYDLVPHNETTEELWHATIQSNLTSAYLVTWAIKDSMIERRFGRIVNIASVAGLDPRPMSIAYSASKAGLIGLTKSVASALAEYEIRCNAIAPGLIQTEMIDGVEQSTIDTLIAATPLGRIGTPHDVADVALFLLSDQSRFTTGQTIVTSGGRVMLP
ncbi:MAG: beta-ketoacyl-ACP reductase, partial [Planctomycetaceae bacterium]|nr:beta-ketoacyl-ACP reductase [Planctomycetaceae bacterium]